MGHKTGEELIAFCGSCKMDLRAVVTAMEGAKIARVLCRTCKRERGYRPPKGVKEPGAQATATAVRRVRTSNAEPVEKSVPVNEAWKEMLSQRATDPRIPYSIATVLKDGDVVRHPTFGEGVVMKLHFPNKAEIIFRDDVRLLLHSKK